ncbi:MAG: polyhydroxyalkanoate synthesis repressor PhaR [Pseudomonadota bacterium]
MSERDATIIKKYANRRLYNTGTSTYVTLDDLGEMVKAGENFEVIDAKSGDDITRSVLTQIIFEQESRGQNLLPVNFLRSLIGFYGDQMQALVPSYLEVSMDQFALEQDRLRSEWAKTVSTTAIDAINDQVQRNMEMWQRAARMFSPFPVDEEHAEEIDAAQQSLRAGNAAHGEIDALKRQLAELQARLDALSKTESGGGS